MKNMKLDVKMPKIKLAKILWVIFVIAVLLEAGVLLRVLFFERPEPAKNESGAETAVRVDQDALREAAAWIEAGTVYQVPLYNLRISNTAGRENPFLEYR